VAAHLRLPEPTKATGITQSVPIMSVFRQQAKVITFKFENALINKKKVFK